MLNDWDRDLDTLDVRISEMLVATADGSDELIDGSVPELLRLLREHMNMDVVFVSEFVDGQRVFRRVETRPGGQRLIEEGQSGPLEQSYCQRVVDGRIPRLVHDMAKLPNASELPPTDIKVGAHLSTPIILNDGRVYGTLCCFSLAPNNSLAERDLRKLEMSAQLAARQINAKNARKADEATANWQLQPQQDSNPFNRL